MKRNCLLLILTVLAITSSLRAQLEVTSVGSVGIGTSSPNSKLEIVDDATTSGIISRWTRNAKSLEFYTGSTVDLQIGTPTNSSLGFYTNNNDPLLVLSASQKVGIGTLNPSFPLSFGSGLGNKLAIYDVGTGSGYGFGVQNNLLQIFANTSTDRVGIGYGNSGDFTETLTIKGNKVGVGTIYPSVELAIAKPDETAVRIHLQNATTGHTSSDGLQLATLAGEAYVWNWEEAGLHFGTSNSERLTITDIGNVGIGTQSPSYKLEVAGTVRATSFISNTNTYADFVFKPDYRLAPLSEVEAHIEQHGHLPGIPNEAEVMEHGIDLAAMQVKLLQKIEELTLHQIAQEKRLNDQAGRIEQLEAENAALRAGFTR